MRRTIIALLLLASAAAVAQPAKQSPSKQTAAKPAPQTGACTIGVASELGEKLTVKKIGYTVFGNEYSEVPVESWRIDDLVIAKTTAALGNRAAVKHIAYHKEAFASLETLKLFRDSEAEIAQGVRTLVAGTRCARYLLVTRDYRTVGTANQSIGGIGLLYDGVGPFSRVNAYALFALRLYDGEGFALLKRATGSSGVSGFLEGIHGPHRTVDKSFWPEIPDKAAQDARVREAIRELVSQGMDAMLAELPLAQ
jgi:hypothetical protein